jgi:hypothetical protein
VNEIEALRGEAITIVLASASYRFLETPFLRMKKRFELVRSRPYDRLLPYPVSISWSEQHEPSP